MAFYRRRYRKRSSFRRRGYGARKSRTLKKVKRDILKCNFPTKVKFIGLPEKKTMFLTDQQIIVTGDTTEGDQQNKTLYLYPTKCPNIKTLYRQQEFGIGGTIEKPITTNGLFANWDKYCVLAVYIRIQPEANIFDGSNGKKIVPIRCYYAMNNNLVFDETTTVVNNNVQPSQTIGGQSVKSVIDEYGEHLLLDKPIFTFNSNEHCTFVLKAPQTMQSDQPVVHKKYEWWSLVDQALLDDKKYAGAKTGNQSSMREESEDEDEDEELDDTVVPLSTPLVSLRSDYLPIVHCGHLYFDSGATPVKINVTINYKIALRG